MQNLKRRRLRKQSAKYVTSDSEDTDDEEEEGHYQVVEISPRHAYNTAPATGAHAAQGLQRMGNPQMTALI